MSVCKRVRPCLLAALLLAALFAAFAQAAEAKKSSRYRSHAYRYLVPPPPAYMPSILPELKVLAAREKVTQKRKADDPAKKYVYTRAGYEDPRPVRPNKHITYWNVAKAN